MKRGACCEHIIDQEDAFSFDASGIVYGEGSVQIGKTFFFQERRLRHRQPNPEKTGQEQWNLEMLTQSMCQQE